MAEAVGTMDQAPVGLAWALTVCQVLAKEGIQVSNSCWSRAGS